MSEKSGGTFVTVMLAVPLYATAGRRHGEGPGRRPGRDQPCLVDGACHRDVIDQVKAGCWLIG